MDRKSTPIGVMYRILRTDYQPRCPPGKTLDDCELRANSTRPGTLPRVKTGEPSFFGRAAARVAHQRNAVIIVDNLISTLLPPTNPMPQNAQMVNAWGEFTAITANNRHRLSLGQLGILDRKIAQIRYLQAPEPHEGVVREADFQRPQPAPES